MNSVELVGRLVADPNVREKVTSFTLAIDRRGKDAGTDFPRVVSFGKTAEVVKKNCKKGRVVSVQGSIITGSYDGKYGKVYTTDVMADEVRVVNWGDKPREEPKAEDPKAEDPKAEDPKQVDFASLDEDVPF